MGELTWEVFVEDLLGSRLLDGGEEETAGAARTAAKHPLVKVINVKI